MHFQPRILLTYPFRVFFLLTGLYGVLFMLGWIAFFLGGWTLPSGWPAAQWHSHEMLYGLVAAASAGFLLTAMTNWTGAPALSGTPLLALALLWLAGRIALWTSAWLPAWLVAIVDLAFLPVFGAYAAMILIRYENQRNLVLVGVLGLLFLGNLFMHLGVMQSSGPLLQLGQNTGFNVITLMMVIVAGRITPAFSANWLRMQGRNPELITRNPRVDQLAIGSIVVLMVLDLFNAPAIVLGWVIIIAGLINGLRLWQWSGWRVAAEPLLWILHLAYFWIVLALLLRGAGLISDSMPAGLWQHTLGVGAMGTLILGVMTRVTAGHTGRPMRLARFAIVIYIAIIAATVLRLLAAARLIDYQAGLILAAIGWILAFGLFAALYIPLLASPRPDGRPG